MVCERVRPLTDPAPEDLARVALESPRLCVAAVVSEELGEHLLPGAHTQNSACVNSGQSFGAGGGCAA